MDADKVCDAFWLPAILAVLVLISRVMLSGGHGHAPDRAQAPGPEPPAACRKVPDEAPPAAGGVYIVEHGGHEYLCVRYRDRLGLVHSATCPKCGGKDKEK